MSPIFGLPVPSTYDADVNLIFNAFVPQVVLASIEIADHGPAMSIQNDTADVRNLMAPSMLHSDEIDVIRSMPDHRRLTFTAGRRALRAAVNAIDPTLAGMPLLSTPRGAPKLPASITGSISHKRTRAIAAVAPAGAGTIGIDLEERPNDQHMTRPSIARRILTHRELDTIAHLAPREHREATFTFFALKEAVYKTIDPYVERYVRFTEVEIDLHIDGTASVQLLLPEQLEQTVHIDGYWHMSDNAIIALAHCSLR